ncbi:hypothetical protein H7I42_06105 [Mycolicibacterium vanbaalenii PYR-1]|nr:hypothetical protein [Mycolicibacterium vanbaalenii PYR-1]
MGLLSGLLAGAPSLPGARCRGRGSLFDPPYRGENPDTTKARHAQALGLCGRCPAAERCRAWFDGLPKARRPRGVVAGQVVDGMTANVTFCGDCP